MEQTPSQRLLGIAREIGPAQPELQQAWQIFLRGIEHIDFLPSDLDELLRDLPQGNDHIIEELGLEPIGDELRVSFLDDEVRCEPAAMIALLQQLADRYRAQERAS